MEINFDKLNQDVIRLYREWTEAVNRLEDNLCINKAAHSYKGLMLRTPYYLYQTQDGPILSIEPVDGLKTEMVIYLDTDGAWRRFN